MTDPAKEGGLDPIMESIIGNMEIEGAFNPMDGEPPYAYRRPHPEGGTINWICGLDEQNKLTSVFVYFDKTEKDRKIQYLDSVDHAKTIRDALVNEAWQPIEPPKISLSYGNRRVDKPIKARRLKRALDKQAKKFDST